MVPCQCHHRNFRGSFLNFAGGKFSYFYGILPDIASHLLILPTEVQYSIELVVTNKTANPTQCRFSSVGGNILF